MDISVIALDLSAALRKYPFFQAIVRVSPHVGRIDGEINGLLVFRIEKRGTRDTFRLYARNDFQNVRLTAPWPRVRECLGRVLSALEEQHLKAIPERW